jgi:hypothetical protein
MITWTDSARTLLDNHNQTVRQQLLASGADPEEVAADLRRHIEEELIAAKIHVATRDDIHRILSRMGVSGMDSEHSLGRPWCKRRMLLIMLAAAAAFMTLVIGLHYRAVQADSYPFVVPYELGDAKFLYGDNIKIVRVLGTSATITVGQTLCVEGAYTLGSRDDAMLAVFSTSRSASNSTTVDPKQRVRVTRGSGEFRLIIRMNDDGYLHISFYPVDSGSAFGGVHFGQGNGVLHYQPALPTGAKQAEAGMVISVGKEGTIAVDGKDVTDEQLESLLVQARNSDANLTVVIKADEATQLKRLSVVMDSCRAAGVSRFTLQSR